MDAITAAIEGLTARVIATRFTRESQRMTIQLTPEMIYRIVTDYEALQDGFADRIEDLSVPLTEVDAVSGMTRGNMQKLLSKSDAKWAREFGWKTLGDALKGTGLALALIVDDERFAPIRAQMVKRERPTRAIARIARPRWLFRTDKARKMGKKRWEGVPPEMRKKMMKKLAKAGWIARRRNARKSAQAEATG